MQSRIEFLLRAQNADGGWGYFPGKGSWLEPTAYAILALHGTAGGSSAIARAWALLSAWQLADGGWRPAAQIRSATWVTALALTACCVQRDYGEKLRATVGWLLRMAGAETGLPTRAASFFHLLSSEVNVSHKAWPWRPGNSSWIEPTAHALVALKKVPAQYRSRELAFRIREGENMVLARRDRDGGWNCGTPNVLNTDLPSYPETTALALLALQGRRERGWAAAPLAERFRAQSKSPLANAWLAIALRCYGENPAESVRERDSPDVMLAALETLGHAEGNFHLLRVGPA